MAKKWLNLFDECAAGCVHLSTREEKCTFETAVKCTHPGG